MATRTTASAGNWNAAIWDGAVPGNGDSAVLNHNVTVTANQTVGTNVAATAAITISSGITLTVNAGITLVVRGDIVMSNSSAVFTMGAGAILEFDSSATAPTSTHYRLLLGYLASVTINGTSGSHCTVRSNAGGGTGSFVYQALRWDLTATYCDFTSLGTSSIASVQLNEGTIDLQHCIFDTCGTIETYYEPGDLTVRFSNVTMKNTTGTACLSHGASPAALTSGTRVMTGCVFDKYCVHTFRDYTITDTLFYGDPPMAALGSPNLPWDDFSGNLLVATGISESSVASNVTDCYYLQTSAGNPHYFQHDGGYTIRGCIFETTATTDDGDCNLEGSPSGPITITVEHCIGLPNAAGTAGSSGTIFSMGGSANLTTSIFHNTWYVRDQAATVLGETIAGHAGIIARYSDNLVWALAGATKGKLDDLSSTVNDQVSAANAHHNAGYNLAAGSNLKGYNNLDFTSGSPGTSDVDGTDPQFVDSARDIAKWDLSLGGAGTYTNALVELKKKNDAGYNTAYTIAALITYVKAGFVPQASAMHAASDSVSPSSGWIGAMAGVAAPAAGEILFVGSTSAGSTDTEDVTTTPETTAGNFLFASVSAYGDSADTTVGDSKSNIWIPLTVADSGGAVRLSTFYVENATMGASHTFQTVCATSGNYPSIEVAWYSGVKLSGSLDQQNHNAAAGAVSSVQAGSVTPTEANELVIAVCDTSSGLTITSINGGFTIRELVDSVSGQRFGGALADLIQTTATAANPTWTFAGSNGAAAKIATFKAEPAAAVTTTHNNLLLLGVG